METTNKRESEHNNNDNSLEKYKLDAYINTWEAKYQVGQKNGKTLCNAWLFTVEKLKPAILLNQFQKDIDQYFLAVALGKRNRRVIKDDEKQINNVINNINNNVEYQPVNFYWISEEKIENRNERTLRIFIMYEKCFGYSYGAVNSLKIVLQHYTTVTEKGVCCKRQYSFKLGLGTIFQSGPPQDNYITNDQSFQHDFVSLLTERYWIYQAIMSNKNHKKKNDPRIKNDILLETFAKKYAKKYDNWEDFKRRISTNSELSFLYATLTLKNDHFKNIYEEVRTNSYNNANHEQIMKDLEEENEKMMKEGEEEEKEEEIIERNLLNAEEISSEEEVDDFSFQLGALSISKQNGNIYIIDTYLYI